MFKPLKIFICFIYFARLEDECTGSRGHLLQSLQHQLRCSLLAHLQLKNIFTSSKIFESPHLLPIPLSLCEELSDDALGEEGPHVRGPSLPHHLEIDLQVSLQGDLVHWGKQSVISVDRDGLILLFMLRNTSKPHISH